MMLADHIVCGNCEKEMFVVLTTEVCPNCKTRGSLTFADIDKTEVEVHEDDIVNLFDRENVINNRERDINDDSFNMDNIVSCLYCSCRFNTEIENYGVSEDNFPICEKCNNKKE